MPQRTLTARQRQVLEDLILRAEAEQRAVQTYTANLAEGQTRRTAALSAVRVAVQDLLGLGDPGAIVTIARVLEPDGTWAGRIDYTV